MTSWSQNANTDIKGRDVNASKQTGWLLTDLEIREQPSFT